MMGTNVVRFLDPFVAGLVCGFLVSIPVGPVNLTVINQALRKGFGTAFLVGLGAITAETFYAVLMLWGHSSLLDNPKLTLALRIIAVVVIAGLGIRYLMFQPEKFVESEATIEKVDQRWHHPRALILGFALTISNLMLVVLWATLATVLFAREWVVPRWPSRFLCAAGVLSGGAIWFLLLAFFVSRAHRRVKPVTLTVLVRGCGAGLVVLAGLLAYKLLT